MCVRTCVCVLKCMHILMYMKLLVMLHRTIMQMYRQQHFGERDTYGWPCVCVVCTVRFECKYNYTNSVAKHNIMAVQERLH